MTVGWWSVTLTYMTTTTNIQYNEANYLVYKGHLIRRNTDGTASIWRNQRIYQLSTQTLEDAVWWVDKNL